MNFPLRLLRNTFSILCARHPAFSLMGGSLSLRPASWQAARGSGRVVVRVGRFRSGIAVVVLAGGLVAASGPPALAAPARPTVTISAKSLLKPVTGDVFVVFLAGKSANAQIHVRISGAEKGDVATLLAQPFPFSGPQARAGSFTLPGATASRSFTVTPTLATRYKLELLRGSTLLATSAVSTVYVAKQETMSRTRACSRPVCRQRIRDTEIVPPSTLSDEISKHWYFYFALNLSATRTPPLPRFLKLDTRVRISGSAPGGALRFTRTISWSFWIGKYDGYSFVWMTCSRDTEATDGLGLPGHHACGVRVIDTRAEYIG
jgi:hypothetical protein